jgi:DNA recombination protein RmuC
MSDTHFLILLGAAILIALLQLVALLRKPRIELPPELLAQLQRLEQQTQSTRMEVAKNDGALDGMANQLQGFTQATSHSLETVRQTVDEKLAQAVAESRTGRTELLAAFAAFEAQLAQRLTALDAAQSLALSSFRTELTGTLGTMSGALRDQLDGNGNQIRNQFTVLQESLSQQLASLVQGTQQNAEQLRTALNERLAAIQADNTAKLEEMRRTVDEKLHATLEQRLGESFKLVSDRLEQVHKGLGEMQTLASSVGDLKRVMTNVKSRGTWGEVQLGAIIDNVLTPDQYAKNVKVVPGSDELVEFAIRLPGRQDEHPVWLPIDSKYPVEHYQRLMDAQDSADKAAIASAGNAFEASIRFEAKKIFSQVRLAAAHHRLRHPVPAHRRPVRRNPAPPRPHGGAAERLPRDDHRPGQPGRHAQQPADGLQDAGHRKTLVRSLEFAGPGQERVCQVRRRGRSHEEVHRRRREEIRRGRHAHPGHPAQAARRAGLAGACCGRSSRPADATPDG